MTDAAIDMIKLIGRMLDDLDIGVCLFDEDDRTLAWNKTFLVLFPEHTGKVHEGEHYSENLRRFYEVRLTGTEMEMIDQYIEAGINRHRQQNRAFVYTHRFHSITASSLPIPNLGRLRLWRRTKLADDSLDATDMATHNIPDPPLNDYERYLDKIPDGLMICDREGRIKWVNKTFADIYRLPDKSIANHTSFDFIYRAAWSNSGKQGDADKFENGLTIIGDNFSFSGAPFELMLPDDCHVRIVGTPTDEDEVFYTHVDITQIKRQERLLKAAESEARAHLERIRHLARQDPLTGLYNRLAFNERLSTRFNLMKASRAPYGILVLDIDEFKKINDHHGHLVGDEALKSVSDVIKSTISDTDFAARIGGEEFIVMMDKASESQLFQLADRIRNNVQSHHFATVGTITLSIGCAIANPEDDNETIAIKLADDRVYLAKKLGRNRVISCDEDAGQRQTA